METSDLNSGDPGKSALKPWIVILLTAPIPLLLFAFFFFKWYEQRTDFTRITDQFIARQNTILAYDAMGVSRKISQLLEVATRDVHSLALISPTSAKYKKFYESHFSAITQYDSTGNTLKHSEQQIYSEIAFYDLQGVQRLKLSNGSIDIIFRSQKSCLAIKLCDSALIETAINLSPGEIYFGELMRMYVPKTLPNDDTGAVLRVALRGDRGIYVLGIDYRQIKEFMYLPTFPYQPKADLLLAYQEGNYIYFMDSKTNIIAHPKYWHIYGINSETGKPMPAVTQDGERGSRPLNIKAYEGRILRDYFYRLLNTSFTQKSVDIFSAANIGGTIRVLSVAPILFSKGQFKETGIFGHVVTGCSVDYFEEPKEKFLPYY